MGLQAGGRRRAAVPSGAARLLHPEYVALPAGRGGGHSAFSTPCRASGHAAGAGGGSKSELLRFFSDISADESDLAVVSVPPLPTGVRTASQVCAPRQAALTRFGACGALSPFRMRRAGCGLPDYSSQRNLRWPRAPSR